MANEQAPSNAKFYRRGIQPARRPAPGEPGTLSQELAALTAFLDLQDQDRQTGAARERRWLVLHAIYTDAAIQTYTEGGL